MKPCFSFSLLVLVFLLAPLPALGQWQPDGTALTTAAGGQSYPTIVSDGSGGAIVTWQDNRNGDYDIYAQRVNASGAVQWTADGVALCIAVNDQAVPKIVSDGSGGAIVTWQDLRSGNYDIYAQRVNASGVVQWTANGVALCAAVDQQAFPTIVSDSAGGAIVTWQDVRSGNADIYAQRVSPSGAVHWTVNGVALCTAINDQLIPTIVADGSGGAIVTWQHLRTGKFDIYAQRVSALGAVQWTVNGVALCTAANDQLAPTIVADGSGGAIVTWFDWRSGTPDIYAQRVNASGALQWTGNGVALSTAANHQDSPVLVSDGSGGAIVTWLDLRSGSTYDVYAQRVSPSGAVQWAGDGVALCTAASDQSYPTIVSDGSGGAIVTWYDSRSGSTYDVYAQRVSPSGAVQWTGDGVALCTAAGDQSYPTIVSDGSGGAIVTWHDSRRSGSTNDVYAQRVEFRYGYWGHPEPIITSVADVRGDQGGKVKVNWKAGDWDQLNLRTISHYSVWRATDAAVMQSAEAVTYGGAEPLRVPADFQGQAFWVQHGPLTDYYWEWVGNQDAKYFPTYSFSTSTRADSTVQGLAQHHFIVSFGDERWIYDSGRRT